MIVSTPTLLDRVRESFNQTTTGTGLSTESSSLVLYEAGFLLGQALVARRSPVGTTIFFGLSSLGLDGFLMLAFYGTIGSRFLLALA